MRLLLLILGLAVTVSGYSQPVSVDLDSEDTENSQIETPAPGNEALRVSSWEIKGRWLGPLNVPLALGDLWTPEKQTNVLETIAAALRPKSSGLTLLNQAGEFYVLYVDVLEKRNEAEQTVDLVFRPFFVHMSFAKVGNSVLPVPRSPFATDLKNVPAPLLALNPAFGLSYDRQFGAAVHASFASDLLALPDTLRQRLPDRPAPDHLYARFDGAKSFEQFYRTDISLDYLRRNATGWIRELMVAPYFRGNEEPLGEGVNVENSGGITAGMQLRLAAHVRMGLATGYQHAQSDLDLAGSELESRNDIQPNQATFESLLPKPIRGFLRASIWEENSWNNPGTDTRLIGRLGYAREFSLSPNQTIGVELISGAGKIWGDALTHRQFFGGNEPGQFLYDRMFAPSLRKTPTGPMIRSFGESEARQPGSDLTGGDGFWHANLNLTIPIPFFSFPLIPQEDDVRNKLKSGIRSGRNLLVAKLKQEGLSSEEARAEADRTFAEIGPATEFIINDANLYSIKPLLMFDAAGMDVPGDNPTWLAAGAGLQITVVTAKLEAGYMRTFSGPTFGDRGNVFVRLVFQNLF